MKRAQLEDSRARSPVAPSPKGTQPRKRARRAVLAIAVAIVTGAVTAATLGALGQHDPQVNTVLDTVIIVIAALTGLVSWGRYRLRRRLAAANGRDIAAAGTGPTNEWLQVVVPWAGFGCTLWAVASVNNVIVLSGRNGWFYTEDYFRLAGILAWGLAAYHEISHYQAEITRRATAEERRRVARDLHDGLAQDLAYLNSRAKMLLGMAAPDRAALSDIVAITERAMHGSRRAVVTLNHEVPGPLGEDLARTAREAVYDLPTRVRVSVPPDLTVDGERHEAMVGVVREAVRNASRHGGAASAAVEVSPSGRGLALRVHDDGTGFDPAKVGQPGAASLEGGFGLLGMEERCRAAGARFKLSSALGRGTTIEVMWP